MAEITAAMVKELRDKTQAGMMEAKKALTDADGDMDAAIRALREKNKNMQVKEGRVSAQGLIEAHVNGDNTVGSLVETNSETDFVARNADFKELAQSLAKAAHDAPHAATTEDVLSANNGAARESFQKALAALREALVFKRHIVFKSDDGTVDAYIHMGGQIGVLLELSGRGEDVKQLAREVAMHVAASRPKYLTRDEVPAEIVETERELVRKRTMEDPKNASKPAEILEKIIEGGLGTYFKTNVLLEQEYIRDPKLTIKQLLGGKAEIRRYARFEIGEAAA